MIKYFLLLALCGTWLPTSVLAPQDDETGKAIRALIPAATALSRDEFDQLTGARAPKIENHTLLLLYMECDTSTDDASKQKEFSYIGGAPDPAELARLIARRKPHTFVRAEGITDFTCEVHMDSASGTAAFEVPNMLRGSFHYKATETDEGWKITEISLPAYKLVTRLQDDGTWKRDEFENENDDK